MSPEARAIRTAVLVALGGFLIALILAAPVMRP